MIPIHVAIGLVVAIFILWLVSLLDRTHET